MNFPSISTDYPLILASASPRRKRLLQQIGLPFRSVPSDVEENEGLDGPSVDSGRLSEKKARAVHSRYHDSWILGADTMVILGDKLLGKPGDPEEAGIMLRFLAGEEHRVVTGFCILDPSGRTAHSEEMITLVKIRRLTDNEINAYIATGEPFGKAGSYAIQGIGSFMIESISGSYTNVVGLPVCALINALLSVRALKNFPFFPSPLANNLRKNNTACNGDIERTHRSG